MSSKRPAYRKQAPLSRVTRIRWHSSKAKRDTTHTQVLNKAIEKLSLAEQRTRSDLQEARELLHIALTARDRPKSPVPAASATPLSPHVHRPPATALEEKRPDPSRKETGVVEDIVSRRDQNIRTEQLTSRLLAMNNHLPWVTQHDLDAGPDGFQDLLSQWLHTQCHEGDPSLVIRNLEGEWFTEPDVQEKLQQGWQISVETRHLFPPDPPHTPVRKRSRHRVILKPEMRDSSVRESNQEHSDRLSKTLFADDI